MALRLPSPTRSAVIVPPRATLSLVGCVTAVTSGNDGLERRPAGPKGDGVFAARSFEAGQVVLFGTVIVHLDRNDSHASQVGPSSYVRHGGLQPLVNHSCDPTCSIRANPREGHDLVALRAIEVNEEVTYDYAMRNYTIAHFPSQCLCGASRCRGRITGWKDLPAEFKAAYRGVVAPYLLELDRAGPVPDCPPDS